jgi:arylsulfatase A-like enzyme
MAGHLSPIRLEEAVNEEPCGSPAVVTENSIMKHVPFYLCAALLAMFGANWAAAAERKPNVIIILSDDAGYADFGVQGCRDIPTPRIDSIADRGIRCTSAYVTASVCAPSRAGLITGRYQQRFGHEFNGPTRPAPGYTQADMGLDAREKTVGDRMHAEGYRCIALGKWHLGQGPRFFPLARGFDEFFGFQAGSRSYFPYQKQPAVGRRIFRNEEEVPESEIQYTTDSLAQEAAAFIRRNKDRPFFIYLAFNAVHEPMHAKAEDIERFQSIAQKRRQIYAAMMHALDQGVGLVLDTLQRAHLTEQTLLVFVNDNGGATTNASDNGPLRGMKGSKWEGGIRVPFLVQWPGVLPARRTFKPAVITLDLLPTSLAAAGANGPETPPLDGVNLLPYWKGEKRGEVHPYLFWRRGVAAAVRHGPWKLIRVSGNPTLLLNLSNDPGETVNLVAENPKMTQLLLQKLTEWEKGLAPPKWVEGKYWEENQIKKHRMRVIGRDAERRLP